jgi:hypothetical protein
MNQSDQPIVVKRGRKSFTTDLESFLRDSRPVSFAPSYMTREHMAYCMKETGMYNKSQLIALALKNYSDMLFAEAKRRQEIEDHEVMHSINPSNFRPQM